MQIIWWSQNMWQTAGAGIQQLAMSFKKHFNFMKQVTFI